MPNDPNNINLGPCRVLWGGQNLGLTKGGVEVEVTTDTKEVMVDQFGNTAVDEYITGRKVMVKCPFVETDIDSMHAILRNAGASLVDDGAKAFGTITFTANAVAVTDVVTVNGVAFTFRTAALAVGATDVRVGATQADSVANLLAALQFSTHPAVAQATYTLQSANVIRVTFNNTGTAGNAFTLAKTGSATTVSGATLTGGVASTRRRIEAQNGVGLSVRQSAQELVLRPITAADNDFSRDFVVPLAGTAGALSFAYKVDEERVFNLSFTGYPNTATRLLFIYGDKRSG